MLRLLFLLLISTSSYSYAQVDIHYLPQGTRCTVGGVTYQCFSLEEYKELLRIDVRLFTANTELTLLQQEIASYARQVTLLEQTLLIRDRQLERSHTELDRLLTMWEEENKLRLEAENRTSLGSFVAWGLSALEAVVIFTMAVLR